MPHIPSSVQEYPLVRGMNYSVDQLLTKYGFALSHTGKVRNTYKHSHHPGVLIVVATDRLSTFDFVLPTLIDRKGEVLTALTHFWMSNVLFHFPNHLVRSMDIPQFNSAHDYGFLYPGFPVERTLVVEEMVMQPFELIFRALIGGSVMKQYKRDRTVSGILLPAGLTAWDFIPEPHGFLFTPSSKEEEEHDRNLTQAEYFASVGEDRQSDIEFYRYMYRTMYEYASSRGIIIADIKMEVGLNGKVGDEIGTPDACRFFDLEAWKQAKQQGTTPPSLDKQYVRDLISQFRTPDGKSMSQLSPQNSDHLAFVDQLRIPKEVREETTNRYLYIFQRITGKTLEEYQQEDMGVSK